MSTEQTATQQQVIKFLKDPAHHAGRPVAHLETHISHVFLVGDRAYKLKKQIKKKFVDYSTLALREKYCRRELVLNRRLAPDLYLGCVAVVRDGAGFALKPETGLDRADEVVEWLVEMVRFREEDILGNRAARGPLPLDLIDDLAAVMADFHGRLPAEYDHGGGRVMLRTAEDVGAALAERGGRLFGEVDLAGWRDALRRALRDQAALLDRRRAAGWVRACHGDLHLGNICALDGRAVPFDAIEFNPDLSHVDVGYELAFPIMDLLYFGQPAQAAHLLNRYLDRTGDYEGLAPLPAFLSLRAGVRALVAGMMADETRAGGTGGEAARRRARAYLDLARRLMNDAAPRIIAVGGLSGSGKSTLARHLAPHVGRAPGAVLLRSDVIRKQLFKVSPEQNLPPETYTRENARKVHDRMMEAMDRALDAGWTVILDATFQAESTRRDIARRVRTRGTDFTGIWLDAPEEVMRERLKGRTGDASDADVRVLEQQLVRGVGALTWARIPAQGEIDEILNHVLPLLQ